MALLATRTIDGSQPPAANHRLSEHRLTALDGMRGIAILSVIAFHTLIVKGSGGTFVSIWRALQWSSWAGVDLFFVLSGFLITGILLDSKNDRHYFRNFYARRTLRIMPLYYTVLSIVLIVVPAVVGLSHLPLLFNRLLSNQLWLWTYLQNYLQSTEAHTLPGLGHFWTLAVEEQFYWVWPIVVVALNRRDLFRVCLLLCVYEPFFRLFLLHSGVSAWAIRQYTFTRIDTLLFGAIAALIIREPALLARRYLLLFVTACSLLTLGGEVMHYGYIPYEAEATVVWGYSAVAILFASAVYGVAVAPGTLAKALSVPLLRWFGKYSYAIYIFHWPLAQAYAAVAAPRLASLPRVAAALCCFSAVTAVSGGIALLSWNLIESRFLKLKRYFVYCQSETAPMPGQVSIARAAGQ